MYLFAAGFIQSARLETNREQNPAFEIGFCRRRDELSKNPFPFEARTAV